MSNNPTVLPVVNIVTDIEALVRTPQYQKIVADIRAGATVPAAQPNQPAPAPSPAARQIPIRPPAMVARPKSRAKLDK